MGGRHMSKGTVNKVILVGRLGADPEIRYAPSGAQVANIRIATNYVYKDKTGQMQEETDWHRIVAWGRLSDVLKEYARKGSRVYVEGRLRYREYEDANGQRRFVTEIIATNVQLLDSPGGARPDVAAAAPDTEPLEPPEDIASEDEEIPF